MPTHRLSICATSQLTNHSSQVQVSHDAVLVIPYFLHAICMSDHISAADVSAHPLGAICCLMLVHVGSQDQGSGTTSRYLAKRISWNACKLLLSLVQQMPVGGVGEVGLVVYECCSTLSNVPMKVTGSISHSVYQSLSVCVLQIRR